MVVKLFCLFGLGAYVALSVADFALTYALLQLSDGIAYESNPIAAACLDRHGWGGLAAFKAALVLVFVGTVGYVATRKKRVAALLAVYGCAMLASVVLYSQQLVGEVRHEIASRGPAWGPPPADPLREPYLGLFAQR
ncbi:MAG: DUF5658 family protein [Gemmataceae bacterium]